MIRYSTLLVGAIFLMFVLNLFGSMQLTLAAIVLGFMLIGYTMPELLAPVTGYSKTLWLPLGFAVVAIAGAYVVFSGSTLQVLLGAPWCQIPPCIPIGLTVLSFVVGSFAKFGTMHLAGEKLDLFGEHVKD